MAAPNDDIEYVNGLRRGDMACFAAIVNRYSARVFSLVAGVVRNRQTAEEITSDVFFKVYERIGDFKSRSSFSTWLYRIAYNAAVSSVRKKDLLYGASEISGVAVADDDECDCALSEENMQRMERALETLSPADRSLIRLYYYEDKSVSEVSFITDMTESNVKTRLFRIRAELKRKLISDGK